MTPLDEGSARSRNSYLTTHNIHNRHSRPRRQTCILYRETQPRQITQNRTKIASQITVFMFGSLLLLCNLPDLQPSAIEDRRFSLGKKVKCRFSFHYRTTIFSALTPWQQISKRPLPLWFVLKIKIKNTFLLFQLMHTVIKSYKC